MNRIHAAATYTAAVLARERYFPRLAARTEELLRLAACLLAAVLAGFVFVGLSADLAAAQGAAPIVNAITNATNDIILIGIALGILALAVGFILVAYPQSGAMAKSLGTAFLTGGVICIAGLGLVFVAGQMIEGWTGGGGGGGGGDGGGE